MFDQDLVRNNKIRSTSNINKSEFFQFVNKDIVERLDSIDREYNNILWIEEIETNYSAQLTKQLQASEEINKQICTLRPSTIIDNIKLYSQTKFDLIIFPYGIHWVNDVQKFLFNVKSILAPEGIFICNFPGSGSLICLRKILFQAEESLGMTHCPHISPFIKFDDVTSLLQQARFNEIITDYEKLTLEYESPLKLMRAIKAVGESNALLKRNYSITKSMHKFLSNYSDINFNDQINLITLIASSAKHVIQLKSKYFLK